MYLVCVSYVFSLVLIFFFAFFVPFNFSLFSLSHLLSSHCDGHLYELDGRKSGPVNHGPSSPDSLLEDATSVVKRFMERDPEELRFTIIALAAVGEE